MPLHLLSQGKHVQCGLTLSKEGEPIRSDCRFQLSRGVCNMGYEHRRKEQSKAETMTTPDKKLAGKVAVVTGASKGIGASIAKHLAAEGAAVVVNYASSKAGADKVVAEITAKGGKAVAIQADVAKKAEIQRLFAESKKAFGALDILVNNAGIY